MEQAREARDQEQVEVWVEAPVAGAKEVVDKAEEVVLRQVRAVFAFAQTVVKERPINWEPPVTSGNVLSAERP